MARLRGEEVFREIEEMTNLAMDGKIPLSEIFGRRLELVRPSREETAAIGQGYIDTVEPHAVGVIGGLKEEGWEGGVGSGGYREGMGAVGGYVRAQRGAAEDRV